MAVYEPDSLLTTTQAARYLGVSATTVRNYIKKGLLKPDVTLPNSSDGRSGRQKFKFSTVDALYVYMCGRE